MTTITDLPAAIDGVIEEGTEWDVGFDPANYPDSWISPDEGSSIFIAAKVLVPPSGPPPIPAMPTAAPAGPDEGAHPDSVLLRPKEVAARLRLSESRIYELMASGEIPSVRIRRSRRVPLVALIDFINGLQV